jgi:hypothetical protein
MCCAIVAHFVVIQRRIQVYLTSHHYIIIRGLENAVVQKSQFQALPASVLYGTGCLV